MSEAVLIAPEPPRRAALLWAFIGLSIAVHASVLVWLTVTPVPAAPPKKVTELVMIEVERPPRPPAPEAQPEPPKPIPPQVRKLFKPKLDPRLLVQPPPNDRPEETPGEPPPVVVGLTLRSTTTAGSFDAPVGNTLAGRPPAKAADPASVTPSPVPLYELDSQPTVIGEVRIPYPEDARSRGIEGTVVLSVLVDETGQVRSVKILSGPGGGLDQAAAKAVERIRFRPALRKGQPVPAQITYRYTFLLD
ncbi:MAG TPA: energy transducer TonB [Myxococcaceae bacterium]|nr:energy transducer TonB [Myxococcaceae bacterium]